MNGRRSIDLTSARRQRSIEYRIVEITTASDEVAAPYKSKGSVYRSRWIDGSTERAADIAGADIWTAFFTTVGDLLLAVQTPFGYWEGIATYQAD
jgi:hypothetical protein